MYQSQSTKVHSASLPECGEAKTSESGHSSYFTLCTYVPHSQLHPPRVLSVPTHSTFYLYTLVRTNLEPILIPLTLTLIPRNPEHHARPTFEDLTRELARDPEELLSWSAQDKAVSSKAAVLGAPLQKAKQLYPRLQETYK